MGSLRQTLLAAGIPLILAAGALFASPVRPALVDRARPDRIDTLSFIRQTDGLYLPVSAVFSGLGYRCRWDSISGRLSCRLNSDSAVFIRGSAFYTINGTLFQSPRAPLLSSSDLFLLPSCLAEALKKLPAGRTVTWNDTLSRLFFGTPPTTQAPEKKPPQVIPALQGQAIRTIVLDPGHGGRDPGAIGPGGTLEKDVVLAVALALRDKLRKEKGLTVLMTREKDEFIPLGKRTRFANEKKADLFISIHANSIGGTKQKREETKGFKTYFLSHAKNEEDKLVAMRENSVIELEAEEERKDFLQTVLTSLAGNEYLAESQDMSILITETLKSRIRRMTPLHLGVGQANFYVLNGAYMPAVLIEIGFISHPQEEKLLVDKKFQDEMASAIFTAIMEFKRRFDHTGDGVAYE